MLKLIRLAALLPAILLGACAVMGDSANFGQPVADAQVAVSPQIALASPAQTTASAAAMTDISAYVDAAALNLMGEKSKIEAAGAQFNALQFGRVGAPRNWQGDKGVSGQVSVGPFVRVNLIDCRDFTHSVTIESATYIRKGTACRDAAGGWSVVSIKAS